MTQEKLENLALLFFGIVAVLSIGTTTAIAIAESMARQQAKKPCPTCHGTGTVTETEVVP